MVSFADALKVEAIPIDRIDVPNPRVRNRASFDQLVKSIAAVGLKRPITVAPKVGDNDGGRFDLVCGQGRLEAMTALGERMIPAVVQDVIEEERMLRSVVENIARRQHRPLELLKEIGVLRGRGYADREIADKTGLSVTYVQAISTLLDHGEGRLITAVEMGRVPLTVAMEIAGAGAADAQEALERAYQSGELRGQKLVEAKRILAQRAQGHKGVRTTGAKRSGGRDAPRAMMQAYRREAERQRLLIKRAEVVHGYLLNLTTSMRQLLADEGFRTLLRAERMETLPRVFAELIGESAR